MYRFFCVAALTLVACGVEGQSTNEVRARQDALRDDDDGIIIMNGLTPDVMLQSALLTEIATREALVKSKLHTSSFSSGPLWLAVVHDVRSRTALEYLARCALPAGASVSANGTSYPGQLGLCPEWATGSIDLNATCQERVSACMLALVNIADRHVPLSIRGTTPELQPAPRVRIQAGPNDVAAKSLTACDGGSAGVRQNCGWEPTKGLRAADAGIEGVFVCPRGERVLVSGGSSCSGTRLGEMTPGSDKVLRVCRGTAACDSGGDNFLAQAEGDACRTYLPEVSFTCPDEGSFVVMQRDYWVPTPGVVSGSMKVGFSASAHRATEAEVFPVREGTFFGTIFTGGLSVSTQWDWTNPNKPVPVTKVLDASKPLYQDSYVCMDKDWNDEAALFAERMCALPGMPCLSTHVGVCQAACGAAASSEGFASCRDRFGVAHDGLTTFLQTRCAQFGVPHPACK